MKLIIELQPHFHSFSNPKYAAKNIISSYFINKGNFGVYCCLIVSKKSSDRQQMAIVRFNTLSSDKLAIVCKYLFPLFFLVLLCDVWSAIRDQRSLWLRFDWLATRCVDHLYYLSTIQRFTFIAFGLSNNSYSSHKIENCTLSWNYQPFGNQESWRIQAYQ